MVEEEGADALGFIMHKQSHRYIEIEKVLDIIGGLKGELDIFLVFVNKKAEFVENCLNEIPHAIPQFHGDEDPQFCEKFNKDFVKAVRVNSNTDFENINYSYGKAKMLLLDSHEEGSYGGTGKPFDWDLIGNQLKIPFLLAGGIDTINVEKALASVSCRGIDVSSGVESMQGKKDPNKVRDLIRKVRRFNV